VGERVFTELSVAGAPPVLFCVDPGAGDPVANWALLHDWIDEPVQRAFLGLIEPEMRVLDLGCHLGTFALPAAALGASVLAVDANQAHVDLLNAAAGRNGFWQLHAVHRAISDSQDPVAFVERSIHGHVGLPGEHEEAALVRVEPATVDGLLEERGWDGVDLVKLDIEGLESVALDGMSALHARGERPAMVLECNASTLPRFGSSICQLRERLVELGYELLLIDHLRPGVLVEAGAFSVQSECVCDYIAIPRRPPRLEQQWRIEPPFTREQTHSRLLDTAAGEGAGYRAYAADLLAHGPGWLRSFGDSVPALRALEADVEAVVREAADPAGESPAALEHALAPAPRAGGRPADMAVWAENLGVRLRVEELERPPEDDGARPNERLLEGASFHVRCGQLVGVVSDRPDAASSLLRVLAGEERHFGGELHCVGPALLLARIGDGLEAALTVAENIIAYAAFLGCAVAEAERRSTQVAAIAGVDDRLQVRLGALDAATVAGLALVTALEFTAPQLLLLDRIPVIASEPVRSWLTARTWQLRQAGSAIVQVIAEPGSQLAPADRMLWVSQGAIVANGHPASVLEARWRAQLGLGAPTLSAAV
jgi:FkbM family methyltransferase